jgi:hypothetical protein
MMEAVRTSETSVDNHFTRQYNPEDNSEHHTRRRENLKSREYTVFKNSVRTSRRTQHFTHHCNYKMVNEFKVAIAGYNGKHTKPINTKYKSC